MNLHHNEVVRKAADKWLKRARYDLNTAVALMDSRKYLYVAFMCQQTVEKTLKAILIRRGKEVLPVHNLVRLAELSGIYTQMTDAQKEFLADLTPYAIAARYGDYKRSLSEIINRRKAQKLLAETEALFKWLKQKLK